MIALMPRRSGTSYDWLADVGTPYAAYYPKGSVSYASSTNDISGNGRNIVSGSMPEARWTAGVGFASNGTSDFLSVPVAMQSTWTVACKFSNHTGSAGRYLYGGGRFGSAPFHQVQPYVGAAPGKVTYQYGSGSNVVESSSGIIGGVICTSANKLYVDGVLIGSTVDAYTGSPDTEFYWGARKVFGPSGQIAATLEALIVFDKTLTDGEALTLYNGMAIL